MALVAPARRETDRILCPPRERTPGNTRPPNVLPENGGGLPRSSRRPREEIMEAPKKPLYNSLYFQVICAILLGIALGHFYPQTAQAMKPLGDGFIKLIKMIIAPIIFLYRGPRRRGQ